MVTPQACDAKLHGYQDQEIRDLTGSDPTQGLFRSSVVLGLTPTWRHPACYPAQRG
jgi:hypothetical protein